MKRVLIISASLLVITASTGRGQDDSSCNSQADRIFSAWKRDLSWSALHESYLLYRQCDDGAYAEAMSDTIVSKLAKFWNEFGALCQISEKDDSFRQFVLKHIDSTTDLTELQQVYQHARTECPSANLAICEEIRNATEKAITEIETEEHKK